MNPRSYYVLHALSGYEQTRIPIELEAEEAERIYELGRNGGTFSVRSEAMRPLRSVLRYYEFFSQNRQFAILDSRYSVSFGVTLSRLDGDLMWTVRLLTSNPESSVSFLRTMQNAAYESWITALFVGPYLDPRVVDDFSDDDEDEDIEDHMQRQVSMMRHSPDAA